MSKSIFLFGTVSFLISILTFPVLADVVPSSDVIVSGDIITDKHRYTMGDNDTKSDAIAICFLEAKRKAIEYAGIYVESTVRISQTDKSHIASSDIKTIAAALVAAEMVSSNTVIDNGKLYVDCVVNAKVDRTTLKKDIEKITADPAMQKQVEDQQVRLKSLENEVIRLQAQLQTAPRQDAIALRQDRTAVFKEIDSLQQKKFEIISFNERKGEEAKTLIDKGMTGSEVVTLLGEPRAILCNVGSICGLNYGKYWVIKEGDFVYCVSKTSDKRGCFK